MSHHRHTMSPDSASSVSSFNDPDTQSLGDSVLDYPMYLGRRYHRYKEGSYLYPNDEVEAIRLDVQFEIIKELQRGRYFFSPLQDAREILDVGTGTGIWAVELADSDLVPNARITGIDLSPIQPVEVPENVYFEVQDCSETDWERPRDSFDLIYSRIMAGSLMDFSLYIHTARKYLKPGSGWLECCELDPQPYSDDNTIPADWSYKIWEETLDLASRRLRRPTRTASHIREWMQQACLVDIQEVTYKMPIGSWPANRDLKKIGKRWAEQVASGLSGLSYKPLGEQGLGWSREQIEVLLADTRRSLQNRSVHAYCLIRTVIGRRPSEEEERRLDRTTKNNMPPPRQSSSKASKT